MATKKTSKPLLMTNVEYSKHRGISAQRVGVLRKSKQLVIRDGKIDAAASDARLDAEADEPPINGETLNAAKTRKESTLADLRQLELRVKSGALVEMAEVKALWFVKGRAVRDGILTIPNRIAHALAAEQDPKVIRSMLRVELVSQLEEISDDLANAK